MFRAPTQFSLKIAPGAPRDASGYNFGLHFDSILDAIWSHCGDFLGYIFSMHFWVRCHPKDAVGCGWCGALAAARRAKALESGRNNALVSMTPAQPPGGRCGGL